MGCGRNFRQVSEQIFRQVSQEILEKQDLLSVFYLNSVLSSHPPVIPVSTAVRRARGSYRVYRPRPSAAARPEVHEEEENGKRELLIRFRILSINSPQMRHCHCDSL